MNQVIPLGHPGGNLIDQIKEILTDPEVHHPKKYLTLLYISLIDVDEDKISDLFKFYYELTSHAIKELKEGK